MKLGALLRRGGAIAHDAQEAAVRDVHARMELPPGVTAEPISRGLRLSGKRLKQRYITDSIFRNKLL